MFDFRFCGDRWIRPRESKSLGAALGRGAVRDEQVTLARVRAIVAKHVDERQEGRGMRVKNLRGRWSACFALGIHSPRGDDGGTDA